MKKLVAAAALAALFAVPTANADIVDYAQLFGGVTLEPDLGYGGGTFEMDTGYNVGGGFGWELAPNFAAGADFMFTSAGYTDYITSLESFSAMVTGTYFFDVEGCRPYIGAGAGGVHVMYDGDSQFPAFSGSERAFGYQLMAGVHVPVDEKIDLTIGYRFQGAGDVTIQGVDNIEYQSHSLSVGFNFSL